MKTERCTFLRELMLLAWDLYRSELKGPSPRTFADALAGAWRWMQRKAERLAAQPRWAKGSRPRTVGFGSMLQSPIRRSLTCQAYASTRACEVGYLTSRIGA